MSASRTIIVAGAGVGGLTAALSLTAKGYRVVVLEKAERLEPIGAGVQLSPNASRILIGLGLHDALAARAVAPDGISLNSARSGGEVALLPLGNAAAFRAGAPFWVIHRADLQTVLLAAAQNNSDIDVRLGWQFEDAVTHGRGLTVSQRHGTEREQQTALAVIGADGIWSTVRHHLAPRDRPQFSGLTAWRGTFDARQLPRALASRRIQLWMGGNAHLVAYPISNGAQINLVVTLPGDWNRPGWSTPGEAGVVKALFADARWPAPARMMVNACDSFTRHALFTMQGGVWNTGPIALLGDAAHAMLPFAAQGAAMAIEDAAVLAKCLGDYNENRTSDIAAALDRYTGQRRIRVARVQRTAQQSGRIYHLGGAAALARDVAIRTLGGRRLLARQDWIYDWRA